MTTPTETEIARARLAYRLLLAFSGETPERFSRACRSLVEELRDGEGEGDPTPGEWLRAAREHTWQVTTKSGRDTGAEARFLTCDANVARILAYGLAGVRRAA